MQISDRKFHGIIFGSSLNANFYLYQGPGQVGLYELPRTFEHDILSVPCLIPAAEETCFTQ